MDMRWIPKIIDRWLWNHFEKQMRAYYLWKIRRRNKKHINNNYILKVFSEQMPINHIKGIIDSEGKMFTDLSHKHGRD